MREFDVDLRGCSMPCRVQPLVRNKRDSIETLKDLQYKYKETLDEVTLFMRDSAQKRIDAVGRGQIHEIEPALAAEIALASGLGRLDIVMYLCQRLQDLAQMDGTIAGLTQEDYEQRFGVDPEDVEKNKEK